MFKDGDLSIRWFSLNEKRISFNQESRRFGIDVGYEQRTGQFRHNILSGYDYIFDSSDLEIDLRPYVNKTGYYGYGLAFAPLDSLNLDSQARFYFRNEQDRYNEDMTFKSNGYYYRLGVRLGGMIHSFSGSLTGELEHKELDWETFEVYQMSSTLAHHGDTHLITANYAFHQRKDDLYTLIPDNIRSQYNYSDTQKRSSHTLNASVAMYPADWLELSLIEQYTQRKVRLSENYFRNNADFVNRTSMVAVIYPLSSVRLENILSYDIAVKDFTYEINSRHTENRSISTFGSWQYSPSDSLRWAYKIDLQRITYPDQENRWDNDLLVQSYRLSVVHYLWQSMKLRNWLILNTKDDVYLDALLSANNSRMRSISLIPECDVLLGDRLLFRQSYTIRADYTNYHYKTEGRTGTFYRQLICRYGMIFDSFPYVARSADLIWMRHPYRSGDGKALKVETTFECQHNEFGAKQQDFYLITSRNQRYTVALRLKHDIYNIYYTIHPQYTWGTWKEYNLLFGCAWQMDHDSIVEISLNPYGDSVKNLDWQISTAVNLRF